MMEEQECKPQQSVPANDNLQPTRKGWVAGSKHSKASCIKMSNSRKGKKKSQEHKAAISAANKGRVRERKYKFSCRCGRVFYTAASNAKFCSMQCKRAARGHGLRHAPEFMWFNSFCAICGGKDNLVGDHCHKTGRARGILCRNCNLAIGNMHDDPARLRAAAEYLEKSA